MHKGRKKYTGQMVALKFISKKTKGQKEQTALRQEFDILSRLEHENIIRWLDNFETDRDFVVVTELAQGSASVPLYIDQQPAASSTCLQGSH